MNTLGIYVHVPFCGKKCSYCDFYSVCYTSEQAELYSAAVMRNLRHYADKSRPTDTLYFGGGTPALLTAKQLEDIIKEVRTNFRLTNDAEITLEANPNTLTPEKLRDLRDIGINRLSVGVQSMCADELKILGRTHSPERAEKAVRDAADAGFCSISCDLMLGIPRQTADSLAYSIERLTSLPITHVSAYILKIEDGTPFDCDEVRSSLPDDDTVSDLYLQTVRLLTDKGLAQYEVSNFAQKGFESRHNCRYWKCQDYLGIGPAAHSCCGRKRFAVPRDIAAFINSDVQPTEITDENPCGFEEFAMLRLRLTEGLLLSDIGEHRSAVEKKIPPLVKAGYITFKNDRIFLTPDGFLVSNSVIERLIFNS